MFSSIVAASSRGGTVFDVTLIFQSSFGGVAQKQGQQEYGQGVQGGIVDQSSGGFGGGQM